MVRGRPWSWWTSKSWWVTNPTVRWASTSFEDFWRLQPIRLHRFPMAVPPLSHERAWIYNISLHYSAGNNCVATKILITKYPQVWHHSVNSFRSLTLFFQLVMDEVKRNKTGFQNKGQKESLERDKGKAIWSMVGTESADLGQLPWWINVEGRRESFRH